MKWASLLVLMIVGVACDSSDRVLQGGAQACVTIGASGLTAAVVPEDLAEQVGATRQVMIETRIVAVDVNDTRDLGVDFDLQIPILNNVPPLDGGQAEFNQSLNLPSDVIGGGEGLSYAVPGNQIPADLLPVVKLGFAPIAGDILSGVQMPFRLFCSRVVQGIFDQILGFSGLQSRGLPNFDAGYGGFRLLYDLLDDAQVQSFLQAAQQNTRTVVLSSPRLLTLNNEQAAIQVIDRVPVQLSEVEPEFRTEVEKTTSSPFNTETGFSLDITPHIRPDGFITLEIHPGTLALNFDLSTPVNIGNNQADLGIFVAKRSVNNAMVLVRDGQTLALGGLIDTNQNMTRGVPFLQDLPLLSNLFRGKTDDMHELLILITPRIIIQKEGK